MLAKPKLPKEFWQMLADVQPHGMQPTAEEVKAWFDRAWPVYRTYKYRAHRRAIASWWSRANREEIMSGVRLCAQIKERDELAVLEAQLSDDAMNIEIEDPKDFFQLLVGGKK